MTTPHEATEVLAASVPPEPTPALPALATRADLPAMLREATAALVGGISPDDLDAHTTGLGGALIDSVRERVRLVRADRPPVVTDADVFPLVRQLAHADEVCRRIGRAWVGAADECVALSGEELLTAKGEQDGIPTGRLIVPDGDGTELVVQAVTKRAPDTYDVSGILGVVADAATRDAFAGGCVCVTSGPNVEGPDEECPEHGNPRALATMAARAAASAVLDLLSSPKWASTKLDAFARLLASAGHDTDAGVLQQARIRGAETWDGKTNVTREQAKRRRRS